MKSQTAVGNWTQPDGRPRINLGPRPADDWEAKDSPELKPKPNAAWAIYSVASFHTHPPVTYCTPGREFTVGPSQEDQDADTADTVPGIVYDYTEDPAGSGKILGGHPKESPAQLYRSLGVNRRPMTP